MPRVPKRSTRVVALVVLALTLLASLAVGSSPADATYTRTKPAKPTLSISYNANRSAPVALEGATVKPGEQVAIFVSPANWWAFKARFFVNDKLVRTEYSLPYDLGGTNKDGTAALVSTDTFVEGTNKITAELSYGWFGKTTVSATFNRVTPPRPTIAEIATGDPRFTTLVTALTEASNKGPTNFLATVSDPKADLTVFAPTNDAFAALGATLDAALADPAGLLTTVLGYHVLASSETGADLVAANEFPTLQGEKITISTRDGNVYINNAKVIVADIQASNGIVHVIDAVLLPPSVTNPKPPAKATIGDQVTGRDGYGVSDVAVDLFVAGGDGLRAAYLGTDRTDHAGNYGFQADAGCYILVFIAPDGRAFSTGKYREVPVCVAAGEVNHAVDAQLVK